MKRALFLLCFTASLLGCRTDSVLKMSEAQITPDVLKKAERACYGYDRNEHEVGSVSAVKLLLEDGFPINHVIDEKGWTLLHLAVVFKDKDLIRFLLKNGASLTACDKYRTRPIDVAYEHANTNLCRMLALPSPPPDVLIDGVPEYILEELFRFKRDTNGIKTMLWVNGEPVSPELLDWLSGRGLKFGAGDSKNFKNPDSGHKEWRDARTGEKVTVCNLRIKKLSETHFTCSIIFNSAPEPLTFYFHTEYDATKEYGYWFVKVISSSGC